MACDVESKAIVFCILMDIQNVCLGCTSLEHDATRIVIPDNWTAFRNLLMHEVVHLSYAKQRRTPGRRPETNSLEDVLINTFADLLSMYAVGEH